MVSVALLGIVVIIALIGIERDLFTKKFRISFVAESGTGFIEGMPVKLSGFRIGRVKTIDLSDDARVVVTLEINRKYGKWLREGTVARLIKEGLIGEAIVEVTRGRPDGKKLKEGDTIPYERVGGIEELVKKATPVLKEIKEIIDYANDPQGDLKGTIRNMRLLTSELLDMKKDIDATLFEVKKSIQNADLMIRETHKLIEGLDKKGLMVVDRASHVVKNMGEVTEDIKPVVNKLDNIVTKTEKATERLPEVTEKVEAIADNMKEITGILLDETPRITRILADTEDVLKESKSTIKGIRKSWPMRLILPPPEKPGLVPLDSFLYREE